MAGSVPPSAYPASDSIAWDALVSGCARARGDQVLWAEFLRRYAPKIRLFIRGAWRIIVAQRFPMGNFVSAGSQESDFFQSVIIRLVENDCAAMKRFSGTTEEQWLAYLAVITRSTVLDGVKHQLRQKRRGGPGIRTISLEENHHRDLKLAATTPILMEREILAQEIRKLSEKAIPGLGQESSARNLLIFRLHFDHDLSPGQIAACQGVNLSKAGVEKVINRLKEHIRGLVSSGASEALMP